MMIRNFEYDSTMMIREGIVEGVESLVVVVVDDSNRQTQRLLVGQFFVDVWKNRKMPMGSYQSLSLMEKTVQIITQ